MPSGLPLARECSGLRVRFQCPELAYRTPATRREGEWQSARADRSVGLPAPAREDEKHPAGNDCAEERRNPERETGDGNDGCREPDGTGACEKRAADPPDRQHCATLSGAGRRRVLPARRESSTVARRASISRRGCGWLDS